MVCALPGRARRGRRLRRDERVYEDREGLAEIISHDFRDANLLHQLFRIGLDP